jgi:RimJ/RimL family protein N-acetyltransferase
LVLKLEAIYDIADTRNIKSKQVIEKVAFNFIEIFEHQGLAQNWLSLLHIPIS